MKKTIMPFFLAVLLAGAASATEIYNATFYGPMTAGVWTAISGLTNSVSTNGTLTAATYSYRITATNSLGRFPYSATNNAVLDGATNRAALISWAYSPRVSRYVLERGTTGTWDNFVSISAAATNALDDGNLVWSTGNVESVEVCPASTIGFTFAETDPEYADHGVKLAGSTMTGQLTNNLGYYGNGIGLTNTPADAAAAAEAVRAIAAETNLQGQIDMMTISRYAAMTNGSEEIYVCATAPGITAARVGTTITMTIPAGVHLLSARVRWDGANGSGFSLQLGTNDMANAGFADRWPALFAAYREDTGALIAGASARLDLTDHGLLVISGLSTATKNQCRFGF